MCVKIYVMAISLLVGALAVTTANGAGILDLFDWDETDTAPSAALRSDRPGPSSCICNGPSCICCVDFNISYVDLGGPGCVHMKYLSQDEGFAVNVSYGNSILHSSAMKGPNPAPICLDVFARLAQVCAFFSELAPTADGLRGCLRLEPRLLNQPQLDFPIGCFRSSPRGMEMEDTPTTTDADDDEETDADNSTSTDADDAEDSSPGISAETLIQVVNESAEQGIAFFTNLLGLNNLGGNSTTASATAPAPARTADIPLAQSIPTVSAAPATSRSAKRLKPINLKHPNQLR